MKFLNCCLVSVCVLLGWQNYAQNEKTYKVNTVAFYNVENLFSLEDDPFTVYHDRTTRSDGYYTKPVYEAKLANLAKVISLIGADVTGTTPAVVGLCEIENREVVEDLVNQEPLRAMDYGVIHYHSPDRRGIDVALIYQKGVFVPTNTESVELEIYNQQSGNRIYTRDQLVVSGLLDGDKVHFIVNHWPSRSGGEARSRPNRIKAAELTKKIIDSLYAIDPYAKIITMGDFNDDPTNESIKKVLATKANRERIKMGELFNPMEEMYKKGYGTLAWRDGWNLFDQIIISSGFMSKDYSGYQFYKAGIFNPPYLSNPRGRYKGYPFRAFADGGFTGGYSDHFPVYTLLIKEVTE
ncbi:MAG TPA: endonuclease/exonuclease/phosphatase family protein [Flavobacteriaceae bacterium]|nr:endonuclease/exonuclease/phosphatase family protein [Flavobacteriaceae bacterium]